MKRRMVLMLLMVFVLSLLGCSQKPAAPAPAAKPATPTAAPPASAQPPAAQPAAPAPATKPFAGQTLKVGFWGGTFERVFQEASGKAFEEATGAKIQYVSGNPGDQLAKMMAARGQEPPFDLVGLDDGAQALAAARGLIEPFDGSKLPNASKVFPEAYTIKGYAPGFMFIQVGIAYDVAKFKQLGIAEPTSWDVLWDPRLKGRVAIPDLTTAMGPPALVGVSRFEGADERNIVPGLNRLSKIDLHSIYASSTDLETRILAGEVWAAIWIDGRIGTINGKKPGLMKFVHPKMGKYTGLIGNDSLSVVKGSKKKELAEALIDRALSLEAQMILAPQLLFSPTRPEAAPQLKTKGLLQDYMVVNPAEAKDRYAPDWTYINTVYEQWVEQWNRTMKK